MTLLLWGDSASHSIATNIIMSNGIHIHKRCKILDNNEERRCPYAHHEAEEQNKSKH